MCPFMPFSGGNRAEIPQKKNLTDKQTDLTVIWDTKSIKTDFLSNPKSVKKKTKKLDRGADRQSADLVFWDTLFCVGDMDPSGQNWSNILCQEDTGFGGSRGGIFRAPSKQWIWRKSYLVYT